MSTFEYVTNLNFLCMLQGVKRAEMSNAIDVYVNGTVGQVKTEQNVQ